MLLYATGINQYVDQALAQAMNELQAVAQQHDAELIQVDHTVTMLSEPKRIRASMVAKLAGGHDAVIEDEFAVVTAVGIGAPLDQH